MPDEHSSSWPAVCAVQLPNASYVWLPLVPAAGNASQGYQIVNLPSWSLRDFCNVSTI